MGVGKRNMEIEKERAELVSKSVDEILQKLKQSRGYAPIIAEEAAEKEEIRPIVIEAMKKYIKEENGPEAAAINRMLLELEIIEFLEVLKD